MASQIKYRPEIDGLRAIAVAAVVLYHLGEVFLGVDLLPGGFLGVDVFFVISGYLISHIIFSGIAAGTFSLLHFYHRRVRRIVPVFLLVVFASLPFAWIVLLPEETQAYARSLLASVFFVSNIWFYISDPYWAEGLTRPFLHTWSLAVEEQFYLILPALMLLVTRFSRKWLFVIFVLLFLVSLIYAEWGANYSADAAFYLLPGRAWELSAGILLAFLEREEKWQSFRDGGSTLLNVAPALGLVMIIVPFFYYSSSTRHPSILTLVPVLGVILVIAFSHKKNKFIQLLSARPVVGLGLVSYGLYLWHYPVYAFGQRMVEMPSTYSAMVVTALSVGLSIGSYYFLERPVRASGVISFKSFLSVLTSALVILLLVLLLIDRDGLRYRYPEFLLKQESIPVTIKNYHWERSDNPGVGNIILVGDSHMIAVAPQLRRLAISQGFSFASSVERGCQLIIDTRRVRRDNRQPTHCTEDLQQERMTFLSGAPNSYVVLGGRLPLMLEERPFDNQQGGKEKRLAHYLQNPEASLGTRVKRQVYIEDKYRETVEAITAMGHTVVLLYPIPEAGWHVPRKLVDMIKGDWLNARLIAEANPIQTSYDLFKTRSQRAYALFDSFKAETLIRVYPEQIFCDKNVGICRTHDGENVYYRDEHHPSEFGSMLISELIIKTIVKNERLVNASINQN